MLGHSWGTFNYFVSVDLDRENLLRPFNQAHVVLIPKVSNTHIVSDFRPINLCSMIYKVVTKSLANRLKQILHSIISDEQSAFVSGCLISDNVIVAYDAMHLLR